MTNASLQSKLDESQSKVQSLQQEMIKLQVISTFPALFSMTLLGEIWRARSEKWKIISSATTKVIKIYINVHLLSSPPPPHRPEADDVKAMQSQLSSLHIVMEQNTTEHERTVHQLKEEMLKIKNEKEKWIHNIHLA